MLPGDVCYVDYGEMPACIHVRLLGCQIQNDIWAIVTPDGDIYDEQMSSSNPDFTQFFYGGHGIGGVLPPGVPAAVVYGFGALTAVEYQQYLAQCRVYAAGARALLGLAPQPAGNAVPAQPAVASGEPEVWVALEQIDGVVPGQVVVDVGGVMPAGHVLLGDRALVPVNGKVVALKKIKRTEVQSLTAKDLRVLPIKFDQQGSRRRDFPDAVANMSCDKLPGGELQLEGPATTLEVLKSLCIRSLTPVTDHERWIRSSEISKTDRSIYEMEVLSKVIEAFVMVDQVNLPNLKGGELLIRRWQLIKEAHRLSPLAPDYSAADLFMGWQQESGVQQTLAKHVSDQLRDQAAIAKEARKAREEAESRQGRGRGRGRGRASAEQT